MEELSHATSGDLLDIISNEQKIDKQEETDDFDREKEDEFDPLTPSALGFGQFLVAFLRETPVARATTTFLCHPETFAPGDFTR